MPQLSIPFATGLCLAAVLATACGGPGGSAEGGGAAGPTPPGTATAGRIWGVTIDDPWNLQPTVDALARLPGRPLARVVFDEAQPAADYASLLPAIHEVSDVMGELLDSFQVKNYSLSQYLARQQEYLDRVGDSVDVWEVGNEINGEWLGATADVVAKVKGAYDLVKARGKPAAVTLYHNAGCWASEDHEMFGWAAANLPASMREGLDYVWISYYEDDCEGLQPDWPAVFARLAQLFPNAKLGIGECGTIDAASKASYLTRYYAMQVTEPRFVGGFFWWYFSEDMVPASGPLWQLLHDAILAGS